MNFDVATIILSVTLAQAVFVVAILLTMSKRSPSRYLLITALAVIAIIFLEYLTYTTGIYHVFPHFFAVDSGLFFLIGPILFLFAKYSLSGEQKLGQSEVLHLIPFCIYYIVVAKSFALPDKIKIDIINQFLSGILPAGKIAIFWLFVKDLHISVYIILVGLLWKEATSRKHRKSKMIKAILVFMCCFITLMAVAHLIIWMQGYFLPWVTFSNATIFSFAIYALALSLYLDRKFFLDESVSNYHYATRISEDESNRIKSRLLTLIEDEKVFKRQDLTLVDLAGRLGIPTHQLSYIINKELGRNMLDLINYYRVQEFKQLLLDKNANQLSILGIAYEVGFNSKTAFYNAFRKFNKTSPVEYKRRAAKLKTKT